MIEIQKLPEIDTTSAEGKLLLAAVAILTSIDKTDLESKRWGGNTSPDAAVKKIADLANKIFYKEEYTSEKKRKKKQRKRSTNITKLLG